ncbi:hypothetical protein [Pseudomonas protegens]
MARLVTPLMAAYLLKPKAPGAGLGQSPVAPGGLLGRYLKLLE